MTLVFCDTETYCETPIGNGLYAYAENASILLFTWAIGDDDVEVWDKTAEPEMPERLRYVLTNPNYTKVWHNSMFDRVVLKYAEGIDMPPSQIVDTMVLAHMHSLPGGLEALGEIMGLSEDDGKIKDGKRLIQRFCKPQPANYNERRATRHTHPEDWQRFVEYAKRDIVAMRELYRRLPKWNNTLHEQMVWKLDQQINDRGFLVDTELAALAIDAVEKEQKRLAKKIKTATGGEVTSARQRDKLLAYILAEHGVRLPDMTKDTIERRLADENLPQAVRTLLSVRQDASMASTSKYKKLIQATNSDGRLRGTLQYCGASRTGRWAGRTFQPQNLPRPSHKQAEIEEAIDALKAGCLDLVRSDVMQVTSSMIRSVIIAPEGFKLCVADLSNIEGRVAAWLAGERWKVDAFNDFDAGTGHDIYKLAYASSFGVDPDTVDKEQRQLGKVQELALGYGGGVGAFVSMASVYGMDLERLADAAWGQIRPAIKEKSRAFYNQLVDDDQHPGLPEKVFVACDSLKRMWRAAQVEIATYWWELEDKVKQAIENKGTVVEARKVSILCKNNWLRIKLPSGRQLCYPSPKVDKDGITYRGVDPYSKKWETQRTYGGKLFENICQAVARDVLADGMLRAECEGYAIVLTVHDELITETPDTPTYTSSGLASIMATQPTWAQDLPLAAAGFETYRYRKD